MAYNPVPTKNTGDTWSASDHNTYLRDNLAAMPPDVFTTKGDLFVGTAADAGARLAAGSNGQVLTADSAQSTGLKWAGAAGGAVAARYKVGSTQAISNSSTTIVNFGTSVFDTDSAVTTGANWRFTVPAGKGGYYAVTAMVALQQSSNWGVGEYCYLQIYKNGSAGARLVERFLNGSGTLTISVTGTEIINLAAGDYIDIRITQNSGGNVTIDSDGDRCHVAIARLF